MFVNKDIVEYYKNNVAPYFNTENKKNVCQKCAKKDVDSFLEDTATCNFCEKTGIRNIYNPFIYEQFLKSGFSSLEWSQSVPRIYREESEEYMRKYQY